MFFSNNQNSKIRNIFYQNLQFPQYSKQEWQVDYFCGRSAIKFFKFRHMLYADELVLCVSRLHLEEPLATLHKVCEEFDLRVSSKKMCDIRSARTCVNILRNRSKWCFDYHRILLSQCHNRSLGEHHTTTRKNTAEICFLRCFSMPAHCEYRTFF